MDENDIGREVVDAAIAVHRELGPGLLETVYEVVPLDELRERGLRAERQVPVAIECRSVNGLPEKEVPWRSWRLCERRSRMRRGMGSRKAAKSAENG